MSQSTQVRLVNDIAAQFAYLPREAAVAGIANHLRTFWDPGMRAQLLQALDDGAPGLEPLAAQAAERLR